MLSIEERLAQLEAKLAEVIHERDEYRKLYELVLLENKRLRRNLFGRKAEEIDPRQVQLAFDQAVPELATQLAKMAREHTDVRGHKRAAAKPHGRSPIPDDLPVERIELPPPLDTTGMVKIGEEIKELVEWRAASMVRVQIVRPKFAWPGEEKRGVAIAELPESPIPRCKAGVGLLAHVIVSKYADHLPLHRQAHMLERQGVEFSRSTLCGWLKPCAKLLGNITHAMAVDAFSSPWIGIDATGVLVKDAERYRRCHFWVIVAGREHVLFRYSKRHNGVTAHELLKGYKGYVLADASSVYHELYRKEDVTEVGCWAHNRRGFFDALGSNSEQALVALGFIKELYRIEAELGGLALSQKLEQRRARAGPVMDAFFAWAEVEERRAVPKSPLGQALQYALNQRVPLRRFLDDARLRLDNNPSEQQLRREVIGRKNWLFCSSEDGAEWNTTFVSLIASCALHEIEPWAYLRDVLSLVARWPAKRVLELSPKFWAQTMAAHGTRQLLEADPVRSISAGTRTLSPDTTP